MDYETALANIGRLAIQHTTTSDFSSANEAMTRFHLIDEIILNCLGWEKADIRLEVAEQRDFSDYELGKNGKTILLIEAKKTGVSFTLPVNFKNHSASIATVKALTKPIAEAIDQALNYATTRGIPICVVSNGCQFLAFIGARTDNVAPYKGRCLIYQSLSDIRNRFQEFWDCLSPFGAQGGYLNELLKENPLPPPPKKLSERINDYPGFKNRNTLATELQTLGDLFLEDIVRSPEVQQEFLENTYCQSGALSQYALVSKGILNSRYSASFGNAAGVDSEPVTTKKGLSSAFKEDALSASVNRRPILLVGDVGAGKSIFINHLVNVQAREIFSRAIVLSLDFGSQPALSDELNGYILREIDRQLLEKYSVDIKEDEFVRRVHHFDLVRFAGGIYKSLREKNYSAYLDKEIEHLAKLIGDEESHLKACMEFLVKGHGKQIVVFLDNVDQRPFVFQEKAFLVAQSLAERWPVTVFISLRPETFNQSRNEGALTAYHPKVFTISPPRVDQVLVARLAFAVKLLESSGRLPWFPESFNLNSSNLLAYMKMLLMAFKENNEIIEFIDNMSGGNVRRSLDFVSSFVGSGHVDSPKILSIIQQRGSYNLPLHEFMRAVLYGDCVNYDPRKSPVPNLFDISTTDEKEHFLLAILISHIHRHGKVGGTDGYVARDLVEAYLQHLSFLPRQIDTAINRALRDSLIATPDGPSGRGTERFRVTTIGVYATQRLLTEFSYVDAMIVDVPIMDVSIRGAFCDTDRGGQLVPRLNRVMKFIEYLDKCWAIFGQDPSDFFNWPMYSSALKTRVSEIHEKSENRQ